MKQLTGNLSASDIVSTFCHNTILYKTGIGVFLKFLTKGENGNRAMEEYRNVTDVLLLEVKVWDWSSKHAVARGVVRLNCTKADVDRITIHCFQCT